MIKIIENPLFNYFVKRFAIAKIGIILKTCNKKIPPNLWWDFLA